MKIPPLNPKFGGGTAKLRVVAAKLVEDYQNAKKRKAKALNAASSKSPGTKAIPKRSVGFLGVVSNIFYFHPYLGKIPLLTNIFQMG